MNMQQMMAQAQKMQRELKKAMEELNETEFSVTKGGAVTITMLGNREVTKVEIDEDAFDPENKEMIQDMIMLAINELNEAIEQEIGDINEKITGQRGGVGF